MRLVWILDAKRPVDAGDVGSGLLDRGARLEPRTHHDPAGATVLESAGCASGDERHHAHRHPEINGDDRRALKSFGRHADDGDGIPIQTNCLANDTGIGVEAANPVAMTEDDERTGPLRIAFLRQEQSTNRGACAERSEVVGGDDVGDDFLRACLTLHRHVFRKEWMGVDVLERRRTPAEIEIVRIGRGVESDRQPVEAAADINETIGVAHRDG